MKKIITVISIVLLMTSCTQVKVAYVNVEEILKEYEGAKLAEEEMRKESEKIRAEIDQLAMSFQEKVQEYQKTSSSLSSTVKQEKEQELMMEQQQLQQRQQMAQQMVQAEGQRRVEKINEEIEKFLAGYAKSNGFTYILGTSSQTKTVLYGEESLEITDQIIDELNENFDSKEDSEEDSEVKTGEKIDEPKN